MSRDTPGPDVTREGDAYRVDTRPPHARPRPRTEPTPGARGPGSSPPNGPRRPVTARQRRRRIGVTVVLVLLAWVVFLVAVPLAAWHGVQRVNTTPAGDRPAVTSAHNYLLVGSDSREGLTPEQQQQLNGGGDAAGKRTDSIILVHVSGSGGKPALVSIPRDSYVPIPGHGSNKINAAYAIGGAELLTRTIEQATGVRLDGYVEIGFAGFASVVDALGGVEVCVPFDMNDKDAAINLTKGCQTLDGPTALGYVRARKSDPRGDIGRAERQRQFLGAIMSKALTPSTVLIPWRYTGFANAAASGLEVGDGTSVVDAVRVLQAIRGVGSGATLSLVVPIQTAALQTPNAGIAVKWNSAQALVLFHALQDDEPFSSPPPGTTYP
ncbi:LCP family protein [Lapillicoccus sp.]|uniref:LCP family protein n=1 Tax=Lapillicoccus sp. TaxID=1909287 RepID=UPI003265B433